MKILAPSLLSLIEADHNTENYKHLKEIAQFSREL